MYDIIKDYEKPMIGEQPNFTEFLYELQKDDSTIGLNGIRWNAELYPHLYKHKDRLIQRFDSKYGLREIGAETVHRWMYLLQNRFDEIAPKYDHAYKLYEDETINLDNLTLGYVRKILYSSKGTGESTTESQESGNSKFRDTPTSGDSTINNPTTENVDTTSSKGNSKSNRNSGGNSSETYDYHDEHVMLEVNKLIDEYKILDEEFINLFNEMFIGILTVV